MMGDVAPTQHLAESLGGTAAERAAALAEIAALTPARRAQLVDATLAAAMVAVLASESRTEQRAAAEALAPLVEALPVLEGALDAALADPRQRLRWGAAFTLARAGRGTPRRLWPAAREALSLADGDQRWAAAELAARLARTDPGIAKSLHAAARDPSAVLRRMALYCLREIDAAGLGEVARHALGDPEATVRLAALAALVAAAPRDLVDRDATAQRTAQQMAEDPDPGVRRAAAAALGRLGSSHPQVAEALVAAAASPDSSLARAARNALDRLHPARAAR
jgi:HEAT repeat protein